MNAEPETTDRAGFVLDLGRCVGCAACVLACRLRNGWPSSSPWRRVLPLNDARRPAGPSYSLSVACHHCENPACVSACPSGAYEQRADGVVIHHDQRCVGCRYCQMACPFDAPRFDASLGIVTKCDFCQRARATGPHEQPACVASCPTGALRVVGAGHADPGDTGDASPVERGVPGFVDPAGCGPFLRFRLPRGIRGKRLRRMLADMSARRRSNIREAGTG